MVQTIRGLDDERSKWGGLGSRLLQTGRWVSTRVPGKVVVVSRELGGSIRNATTGQPSTSQWFAPPADPGKTGATLARFGLEPGHMSCCRPPGRPKRPDLLIRAFRGTAMRA